MDCSMPGLDVHHQLPELIQTHVHWVSDATQPSYTLSFPSPSASIFPRIRVFSNESALHIRWPKYWSSSFSISPSNEYSGLISFRIDWFDLFAVRGTLKSLLEHHSSKASILQHSAFFMVQLSHPYMTTGKTIALTRWTFVGKVMSLLFNMLSRLFYTLEYRLYLITEQDIAEVKTSHISDSVIKIITSGLDSFPLALTACLFWQSKLPYHEMPNKEACVERCLQQPSIMGQQEPRAMKN